MTSGRIKRAVFLDRDGVVNKVIVEEGKVRSPRGLHEYKMIRGIKGSLVRLKDAGYLLIIITNQPELSRGLFKRRDLDMIHEYIREKLPIDDIYLCPHDDHHRCDCRKPKAGMLFDAASAWQIDLSRSFFIGDTEKDIKAGITAGCMPILIETTYNGNVKHDNRAKNIKDAVDYILCANRS